MPEKVESRAVDGLNSTSSADIVDIPNNSSKCRVESGSKLDFSYERTIAASVPEVWDSLIDPDAMTPHLPGTAKVVGTGLDAYRVSMKMSMGFLRPTVNADVQLSNLVEHVSFEISLTGKSMGAGVTGTAEVALREHDSEADSSYIQMTGSIQTSGLLKKIADSKIENAATGFLEAYFQSVERGETR